MKNHVNKIKFNYNLGIYQRRVEEFSGSAQVKSLREEIGVLRLLLEARFKVVKTEFDLLQHTPAISELVSRINVIVTNCSKLEEKLGLTLDKDDVKVFADGVVELISAALQDTSMTDEECSVFLEKVTNGLSNLIEKSSESGSDEEDSNESE